MDPTSNYYKLAKCEVIDVIEQVINNDNLTPSQAYAVGNALKYLLRLGRKDGVDGELYKAENYIHRARTGRWLTEVNQ